MRTLEELKDNFKKKLKEIILESDNQYSINDVQELNKVLLHISNLIQDSYTLYNNDSYNTSVCLSILAMEEISKANIGNFQGTFNNKESDLKKGYLLKNHRNKDILSTSPTICIGERLKNKIGIDKILAIMTDLQCGHMTRLREDSIYYFKKNNKIHVPKDIISKEKARDLLLYVIEEFDDILVGLTHFSYELAKKHDVIFDAL